MAASAQPALDPPRRTEAATLAGRVVLVTGAGRGIGRGIASAAAARGAAVLVTALNIAEATEVADAIRRTGGTAHALACDVTDERAVAAAVAYASDAIGCLDAVVHNATGASSAVRHDLDSIDEPLWDDQVAVGLRALYFLARHAGPALERRGGTLLVMTSKAAFDGAARQPAYAAVKGAQRGFVQALARDWGVRGMRVNAISPSAMTPALAAYLESNPDMRETIVNRAALRRFGDAETDIGAAACFLIGDDARFVTGQTLVVDGGALMR